jgi:phage tail-like protein
MALDRTSSGYLQSLPAIFSEDPFLGRFLLAFEQILTGLSDQSEPGLEELVARIPFLFDPNRLHMVFSDETELEEFLNWLSGWVALSLRADWTLEQKKNFLADIAPLYRSRGTKENLSKLLKIYTRVTPEIIERDDDPELEAHSFRIKLSLSTQDPKEVVRQQMIATALIDLQKPAHTKFTLITDNPSGLTMQLNIRSTIGEDTLIASEIPLPGDSEQ